MRFQEGEDLLMLDPAMIRGAAALSDCLRCRSRENVIGLVRRGILRESVNLTEYLTPEVL